jgi:hypothetical protein
MPDDIGEVTENETYIVSGIEIHFLYPSLKIGISRLSSKCGKNVFYFAAETRANYFVKLVLNDAR